MGRTKTKGCQGITIQECYERVCSKTENPVDKFVIEIENNVSTCEITNTGLYAFKILGITFWT
jgi:hypothetical protein